MSALTDQLSKHNDPTSRLSLASLGAHPATGGVAPSDIIEALSSSEDGIKKSLIIDMKDLVGDAVGNVRYYISYMRPVHSFSRSKQMSISPSYRDLVLAACVHSLNKILYA